MKIRIALFIVLFVSNSCQHEENQPPPGGATVLIGAEVKIKVGDVLYENLDAPVKITGYDAMDNAQWSKEYEYVGPHDTMEVQNGFHHYSIALLNKWGVNDVQSDISGKALWEGRVDGPSPLTYGLGGSTVPKKLSMVVYSSEVETTAGIVYQPESRLSYRYNGEGRLEFIHHESYNSDTQLFEETSTDAFEYQGVVVSKITNTFSGQPDSGYRYRYRINNIIQDMFVSNNPQWTLTAAINYDTVTNNKVTVNYSHTNGNSFSYAFDILFNNIVNDVTTQGGRVCNQGSYIYDKNINPFRHLGYTDINFLNWSINNKVNEDVDYLACSFPSFIPVSYAYAYDQDGYPVEKIICYQASSRHRQEQFYYK